MVSSIKSKLDSMKSVIQVYENGFGILRVYFFGGETIVFLRDLTGGRLPIRVSRANVGKIISLGKLLTKFKDKYEVSNIIKSIRIDFAINEPNLLKVFCLLGGNSKYIACIQGFNGGHYLITDVDGVKWIVRRESSTSLRDDALFGPLLAYYQEPQEYGWFLKVLRKGGVFVDVGANVGGYSVRACKKGIKTIAVEPDPDNCRVLKLNLQLNQCTNAIVLNIAAGSTQEIRPLYFGGEKSSVGYSVLQGEFAKEVKCSIEVKPLDATIMPLLGEDEWVDLLKIDVEGFEVDVIKGALNLLKKTRHLIVEVMPSTDSKIDEVLNLLRPIGFKLIDKVCRHSLYCDLFLSRCI